MGMVNREYNACLHTPVPQQKALACLWLVVALFHETLIDMGKAKFFVLSPEFRVFEKLKKIWTHLHKAINSPN